MLISFVPEWRCLPSSCLLVRPSSYLIIASSFSSSFWLQSLLSKQKVACPNSHTCTHCCYLVYQSNTTLVQILECKVSLKAEVVQSTVPSCLAMSFKCFGENDVADKSYGDFKQKVLQFWLTNADQHGITVVEVSHCYRFWDCFPPTNPVTKDPLKCP